LGLFLQCDLERFRMNLRRALSFTLVVLVLASSVAMANSGQIPHDRLLTDAELVNLLGANENPEVGHIQQLYRERPANGLKALAAYYRDAYSERYYFDWKNTGHRFSDYRERFSSKRSGHAQNRDIHMGLYPPRARWKLPYENLKGNAVTAYELRHLARQHKVSRSRCARSMRRLKPVSMKTTTVATVFTSHSGPAIGF
jgi:hypothetical protein